MAYNEKLADRTRELISITRKNIGEKKMFGGLCYKFFNKYSKMLASEGYPYE